jgi:hypothetical protein
MLPTKPEMLPAPPGIQLSRELRELVTPHKTHGILPTRELPMLPLTARTRATKPRTLLEAQ